MSTTKSSKPLPASSKGLTSHRAQIGVAVAIVAGIAIPVAFHFLLRPDSSQNDKEIPNSRALSELKAQAVQTRGLANPSSEGVRFPELLPQSPPRLSTEVYGKVILEGTPPPELEIAPLAQDKSCGPLNSGPVFTRHYILGNDKGLANVVVYIVQGLPEVKYPVPETTVLIDQKGCLYEPYISAVRAGQKITFRNSDRLLHNIHATAAINREFNFAQPIQDQESVKSFDLPEVMVRIKCDVHNWMFAYVAVIDHPFFAITDTNGNYRIPNLPTGEYVIEAYHVKAGRSQMKFTAAPTPQTRVNFTLHVPQ